jgi:hypothetical protein
MGEKSWGLAYSIGDHTLVGTNSEIPVGSHAYVFNAQPEEKLISKDQWEQFLAGDLTSIKNQIEAQVHGAQVKSIQMHWDSAIYGGEFLRTYAVKGFRVEALVYNAGGGITGLEIIAILIVIGVLAVIFTAAWVVWAVVSAAQQLGPGFTVLIGLSILGGIGILAFVFLGGKAEYRGKKRRFRIGGGRLGREIVRTTGRLGRRRKHR